MNDITRFLKEDLNDKGDVTTEALFTDETAHGIIISKEACILAGLDEAKKVFDQTGAQLTLKKKDGDSIQQATIIATIKGPVKAILTGERLALNLMGRMSGIATETKQIVEKCMKVNPNIEIAATRKTTPGFRIYEKKAVKIGGGHPHRMGLYDAIMIKDNHLKITGSITHAIDLVRMKDKKIPIEIEVENETDAIHAAEKNVDVIMLDNFSPDHACKVAQKIRQKKPDILIEISGGITPDNILQYALFADRISLGYLTHSVKNKDFSLELYQEI